MGEPESVFTSAIVNGPSDAGRLLHAVDGLPELTEAIRLLTSVLAHEPTASRLAAAEHEIDRLRAAGVEAQYDAHGRLVWAPPTRFDPDDRSTWPADGEPVLVCYPRTHGGEWSVKTLAVEGLTPMWVRVDPPTHADDFFDARVGDLWLPLPPMPGGES